MSDMEPGSEFGGYRIERLIGAGGFCTVYLAEDLRPALRRKVALKVLNRQLSADPKNRERFQRESLLAVELDEHPNIVGVLDAGEHDGQLFIAQRFIEGHDLGKEVETGGPLDPERAVKIITEVADALDTAHRAGLVHRDVKPRNILIRDRDDRAFLADFGLTKRTAASDSLTGADEFLGTFAYAAPEQLGGEAVDGRADIYALGCVLFESLTGMPPFSGDIHSMITAHLTKAPPRLSEARVDLPPAIDAVVDKAMAKDPADRYQTADEFAVAARRALLSSGLPPPVVPQPPSAATTSPGIPVPPTPVPAAPGGGGATPPPPGAPVPSPPPGPSPSPASSSGGGSSKLPLLVGGVVVLLLVVVGAVVLLGGGDDGPSEEELAQQEAEAELADREEAADDVYDDLPAALREDCELGDVADIDDDDIVAEMDCDPGNGIAEMTLVAYDDRDDLGQAFADNQERAAQPLASDEDCTTSRYAVHSWATQDDPEGVAGQVACYLDGEGGSGITWTLDEPQLLGEALRTDENDGTLYQWWADLVDREAPVEANAFPNPAEQALLTHVPASFRNTCVRAELRPNEISSVQCTPRSRSSIVFYSEYPSVTLMSDEYRILRENGGVDSNTGEVNTCPFEGTLTVSDVERGRVFCAFQADGDAYLVWTNRPTTILSEATIAPGTTVRQFWRWWTTAGPLIT